MKTRNKVLAGLALSSILATSIYANCDYKSGSKHYNENRHSQHNMYKGMHKRGFDKKPQVLRLFKKLNLSDEQRDGIRKIVQDSRENRVKLSDAFTKNSFDKNKFIELRKQKRENMLKSQAEILEKAYMLLSPKQKEQLKVLMDLRSDRNMHNGQRFSKHMK